MSVNAEILAILDDRTSAAAVAFARIGSAYVRSLIYHKFTGQPKRGLLQRLLPAVELKTPAAWQAAGVPPADLELTDVDGVTYGTPWWETGDLFYEISERRLDREDYARRLAARTVSRHEWKMRSGFARRREKLPPSRPVEAFAYGVMGELVGVILALAARKESP